MTRPEAFVNPPMLQWARQRADLDVDALANKMGVKPEKILLWETGQARPTMNQAQTFADKTHVSFNLLFRSSPPADKVTLPDLRTVKEAERQNLSVNFRDLLHTVQQRQEWYHDLMLELGEAPLAFIRSCSLETPIEKTAASICQTLGIDQSVRQRVQDGDNFRRYLIRQAEDAGILVLRSSCVGSNTHRPLKVEEFRGFAIVDEYAPLVFINSADAESAQIFTLVHELAHLWIGHSGISNPQLAQRTSVQDGVERYCNQVAAEVLVPGKRFEGQWNRKAPFLDNVRDLARAYSVSQLVIGRRAFELGLVAFEEYQQIYKVMSQRKNKPKDKEKGGGPDFNVLTLARNGRRLTMTVVAAALEGRLMLTEATKLLGVNVQTIRELATKLELA